MKGVYDSDDRKKHRSMSPYGVREDLYKTLLSDLPVLQFAAVNGRSIEGGWMHMTRAKVPGGWLLTDGDGMTFYPDPQHQWDGGSLD